MRRALLSLTHALMSLLRNFSVRELLVDDFKRLIGVSTLDGKKIWAGYQYIKSEIMNHWLPHFEIKSCEQVDDAVERVRIHVWAYRANRTIKAQNKKDSRRDMMLCRRRRLGRKRRLVLQAM